ncbi:MAG: hypothetical protein ABL901_15540 [Hyphomicrobiaceae bacterium]
MAKLEQSVRSWVLAHLPYDKSDNTLDQHLQSLDAHGLLVVCHNWMSRLVKPQPRSVAKSAAFLANPVVTARKSDFDSLIADIEAGNDLKQYLSRGVKVAAQVPGVKLGRRQDLDLMLTEWGVHHLHISSQVESDGFVKRDGPLLFAVFRPATAYLVDVMGHGDWNSEHVLRTMYQEWPKAGIIHALDPGLPGHPTKLVSNRTEAERGQLRKAGINSLLDLGGGVIVKAAAGMSGAGTAIGATVAADRLLEKIEAFEDEWTNRIADLKQRLAAAGFACPDDAEFEFAIMPDGYGVIETKTRTWIPLVD